VAQAQPLAAPATNGALDSQVQPLRIALASSRPSSAARRQPRPPPRAAGRGAGRRRRAHRLPRAGPHRLSPPGPRGRGGDDRRRPAPPRARRGDRRVLGGRQLRGGVERPPAFHRGRAPRGRRDPPRPAEALPAHVRALRRAALLRGGGRPARDPVAPRRWRRARDLRGLLGTWACPSSSPSTAPGPGQRRLLSGPGRRGRERRRPRDRGLVAIRSCARMPS